VVSVSGLGQIDDFERPAQSTLEPGIRSEFEFTVEGMLVTDVGGTVAVIERTCTVLALGHLPEGKATVGFEICIKHVAGALEGARCTVHANLREIVDGRKLRFDVEVRESDRTIGVGTHERRVIDIASHAQSAGR
jgi:predicted thioesterase